MCDKLSKKRKRSFQEAWLTDDRYKSWIRKVSDNNFYYCNICRITLSCETSVSEHMDSQRHKNNLESNSFLCTNNENDNVPTKIYERKFKEKWLHIKKFKHWLREDSQDIHSCYCSICDMSFSANLAHIDRHAKTKKHIDNCTKNLHEISTYNENSNTVRNESLVSFDERRKEAEIRYAALIVEKNIPQKNAKDILSFFQHIGKDPEVLQSMRMGRTKCKSIITNVLCPVETERVINKIQKIKFAIFVDETSDICNTKWMTLQVRYVDPETLDIRSQLLKLIDVDPKDCSAKKLFDAFEREMNKLEIPFFNIIALSCDNASVMTGKHLSFKKLLQEKCPRLLTFPCPCHSAALAANAACNAIPDFCEVFIRKVANYINSSPKRTAIFREFCECFQETSHKILKLCDTRWLSRYFCIERLVQLWDTIAKFLNEGVVSEQMESEKHLLSIIDNVDTKAYFLFLKYALNFFNEYNAYFQALETRINVLQPKSFDFFYRICRNFLKDQHLKPLSVNIMLSEKENQKSLEEIDLGSDCNKYLDELLMQGHEDIVTTVRQNCLTFYISAAEEIRKRLPIDDIFLTKLTVLGPSVALLDDDRETSFNDVSFVCKAIGEIDEKGLKEEWIALPSHFTDQQKEDLSKLNFDNMWKKIFQWQHPDDITEYPNLKHLLDAIRSLPNSNADPERTFSLLGDVKTKKRNSLSSASVNAICVVKSALNARKETCINMVIGQEHFSRMSANILYATNTRKDRSALTLYAGDINDFAGPSTH